MVMYATAAELASYLQQDLDTSTATLVLTLASGRFSTAARTWWAPQAVTYQQVGTYATRLVLPFDPVTAVSAVRINGVAVTGFTLIGNTLYRSAGFGTPRADPPDRLEVDLTHGYTAATDDVKAAVLDTAAQAYQIPVGAVVGESIDDYAVRYATTGGGLQLTSSAADLATSYRVPAVA